MIKKEDDIIKYELPFKTIDEAFEHFAHIISDKDSINTSGDAMSHLAYQIDAYALATILNFFNNNNEITKKLEQSNLLVIRMCALVSSEIIKCITDIGVFDINEYLAPNSYGDIVSLRNKIHQFRYREFDKNIKNIDSKMGRSRDVLKPHLDICIKYNINMDKPILVGSNIYHYHFEEASEKIVVNFMQRIIRTVENMPFYPPAKFVIEKSKEKVDYRWEPYCYTDIIKNSKIANQRVVDRVLLAFEDLCSVKEFFESTIHVGTYLKNAPYLLYYFCKMVAVFLDETLDNLEKYTRFNTGDEKCVIKPIVEMIDVELRERCRIMRNNLHYGKQESINLGNVDDMYDMLIQELQITNKMIEGLREILNINPSKLRLIVYRFLRWVQMP